MNCIVHPINGNNIIASKKNKGELGMEEKELIKAGNVLREYRKCTGLSVHKVGNRIGVSGGYIAKIERGENIPSDAALVALAELYNKNEEELFRLYNKVESDEIKRFSKMHPAIRRTITAIFADKDFTEDEALKAAERLKEISKDIIHGEDR